ncbi:DUF1761 domain-containing protein [Lewinella sp. IMCC34183]|uniref:DUF1761 domain-containing protein n=1 Tax=Lewinella sp. IMCC34183 TaxID=2248762 RepID=UPI0018E4EDEC|nr:DUF1761 domain-containing protein [Lewinella sp. IMCC34183]
MLAFLAYSVLGGLWFTVFFKRAYASYLGKTPDTLNNTSPIYMAGPAVCSLVITVTTAWLMQALGIRTYAAALAFALMIGVGYLVANTVNIAINPNMPQPLRYGALVGAFHLTGLLLVSLILVACE